MQVTANESDSTYRHTITSPITEPCLIFPRGYLYFYTRILMCVALLDIEGCIYTCMYNAHIEYSRQNDDLNIIRVMYEDMIR